jgi:hypothetical protein
MGYGNVDDDEREERELFEEGKAKHREPTEGFCTNPSCGRPKLVNGEDGKKALHEMRVVC